MRAHFATMNRWQSRSSRLKNKEGNKMKSRLETTRPEFRRMSPEPKTLNREMIQGTRTDRRSSCGTRCSPVSSPVSPVHWQGRCVSFEPLHPAALWLLKTELLENTPSPWKRGKWKNVVKEKIRKDEFSLEMLVLEFKIPKVTALKLCFTCCFASNY